MISQKEAVDEILSMWRLGEYCSARFLVKTYKHILSSRIYESLCDRTGIVEPETIPKVILQAQKIMGGKVFNQYGIEVHTPYSKGDAPIFGKK